MAALWFLGIAGVVNGVAHPALAQLALRAGSYFPGLITSPLIGGLGLTLLRRLTSITQNPDSSSGVSPG